MAFNKILRSMPVRVAILSAGVFLISAGTFAWGSCAIVAGAVLVAVAAMLTYRVWMAMKENSNLMLEAIRNGEYSFKLNLKGTSSYERVLQDTLNQLGDMVEEQKMLYEQREQFFGLILSNVTTGIIVLDEEMKILQSNPVAATLLHLPVIGSLKQLEKYGSDIPGALCELRGGQRMQLDFFTATGDVHLLVKASVMQLGDKMVKILAFSDIKSELDAKELDTWIKMSRVLTHEIMNSVAPIVSLSGTFLTRDDVRNSDVYEGIRAIHETSSGLVSFVNNYRVVSTLQKPSPMPFRLVEVVKQIEGLRMVPANIKMSYHIDPSDLIIYADPDLIRQVLINVIKNAVQAIGSNDGRIYLRACVSVDEHIFVYISNNGPIIPHDEAEDIFVPFFTTKKDGNGIGLSLSRQIMKLSGGSISLLDSGANGWNVTFLLEFE